MTIEQSQRFERAVAALIEMQGMVAENMQREQLKQSIAYDKEAFDNMAAQYQLNLEDVMSPYRW